jgi:hypothetical protein
MRACLQEFIKRLEENHGNCAESLAKKAAADAASAATVNPDTPNVLQAMMKLEQANARAKTANKVALEEEKEKDTVEKTVEELKRQLQPKRAHTDDDAGDVHDLLAEFDNCDLSDHRREGTRVQNRRNVQVGSRDNQQKTHTVKDGFLHLARLGLVGWISYWCFGDSAVTVFILVALMEGTPINEIVVMYQSAEQVIRPSVPPDVSVCKGIMSCFSFLFLGVPRNYAKRPFSFWCKACSRVLGRGLGSQSSGPHLLVEGCTRTKQTAWTEDQFTVTSSAGIRNREKRVADIVVRELKRAKPGAWGCIQTHEVWSGEVEVNMRSGHFLDLQVRDVSW